MTLQWNSPTVIASRELAQSPGCNNRALPIDDRELVNTDFERVAHRPSVLISTPVNPRPSSNSRPSVSIARSRSCAHHHGPYF